MFPGKEFQMSEQPASQERGMLIRLKYCVTLKDNSSFETTRVSSYESGWPVDRASPL